MFRRMFFAVAALAFVAIGVIAGEHKGAIVKYEEGKSLTLKTKKDGEKTLKVSKDAKVTSESGKTDISKMLEKNKDKGVFATVITNDKDEVTEIKLGGAKKKDKK